MDWNYLDTMSGIERVSRPDWKVPELPLVWRGELETLDPKPSPRVTQVNTESHGSPFAGAAFALFLWVVIGIAVATLRGCS